jgi:2-polyprenyl-6-methoxyphenol hydroxylase-like FAD-dependent oxidoreductase
MSEQAAQQMTQDMAIEELTKRSAAWRPELRTIYDMFRKEADPRKAIFALSPVYNGKPPARWYSDKMMLMGDAAHPYGPGGQGISMALKDAKHLCELIIAGFTEQGKRQFQESREKEARFLGESAEKRNMAKNVLQTSWAIFWEGIKMKLVQFFTRGVMKF